MEDTDPVVAARRRRTSWLPRKLADLQLHAASAVEAAKAWQPMERVGGGNSSKAAAATAAAASALVSSTAAAASKALTEVEAKDGPIADGAGAGAACATSGLEDLPTPGRRRST